MRKRWNIFFGILGILEALIGLIFALLIGIVAIDYELFSFIVLIIFSLLALVSTIYSFKGKKWAKISVIISFVVIFIVLYNLFSLGIDLFLL